MTNNTCRFIVFSDIHYASKTPVKNGMKVERKLTQLALLTVDKLVQKINDIHPDIVVNLGDLIEDTHNHDQDINDFKTIWNTLQKIKTPFYSLIGNHDLRSMDSRKELEEIMGYENATFSIDIKGYHFIFLGLDKNNPQTSTESSAKGQKISQADITWLKKDLAQNKQPCFIFNHAGIAEDDMIGNWWFEKRPENALLENRDEIKEILKKDKNIIAVFSGHQHWTKKITEDNIDYYLVGSLTEDMSNNGIPDGVYLDVNINGTDIHISNHHIKL